MSESSRRMRRYVAIALVGALHALVFELFIRIPQSQLTSLESEPDVSTLFFEPTREELRRSATGTGLRRGYRVPRMEVRVPVVDPALPSITAPDPTTASSSVDWMAAADAVAADISKAHIGLVKPGPAGSRRSKSSRAPASHSAGEQYRLSTGELVVWLSDHCFIISDPPALGTPNAFAHEALTRTSCVRSSGPRGNLFSHMNDPSD
jgi:hypothetical protein